MLENSGRAEEPRRDRIERLTSMLSKIEEDYADGYVPLKRVAIYSNEIQKLIFEELVEEGKLPLGASYYDYGVIDIESDETGEVLYTRLNQRHRVVEEAETLSAIAEPQEESKAATLKLLGSLRANLSSSLAKSFLDKINTTNLSLEELQSIRTELLRAALQERTGYVETEHREGEGGNTQPNASQTGIGRS